MNKLLNYFLVFALLAIGFSSCDKDDDPIPEPIISDANGLYFSNYGGAAGATITKYDLETEEATNNFYEAQNNTTLNSKVQYACEFNNKIYLMGNSTDQVIVLDSLFRQTINGISTDIATPRYCVGSGDFLYISCLGANPDWSIMADSYIAKFNVNTNEVVKTIPLAGGPEGLAIADGKLFVALNYKNSIGVIDLSTDAVSYITTPAVSSYFVIDGSENLYVSMVSTYSNYSESTGLGYINTSSNTLDTIYHLDGVSGGYSSILAPNFDHSIIYTLASSWVQLEDETWVQQGAIYSFDTTTKEYTPFIENLTAINGMVVNPSGSEGEIYVFGSDYSAPGMVSVYSNSGTFISEFDCGISPYWAFFLNYEE